MSKVLVTESYLTDIGDAIRSKNGGSTKYKPSEMAAAIKSLTGGSGQDNTVLNSILGRSISGDYVNDDATEIGIYAFNSCKNLTSATFKKVTKIGSSSFGSCSSLESISLPEVREIGISAFSFSNLKSISMPKVEILKGDYGPGIFFSCPMTVINIPSTIQSIGKNAFNSSHLTTITIDRKADAISGSPWGATGATVSWTGTT